MSYTVEALGRLHARVDPAKLQRVLLNLLSNAFKFTPGIPSDQRETMFERFRQLEAGTTRRFGGTGLGLAIARDLVALHGGTLTVTDAPEGGALFVVDVPETAPPGVAVHAAGAETVGADEARQVVEELRGRPADVPVATRAGGTLVLVLEDNAEMNRFICEGLAAERRVASAMDGKEGLRKALELRPDLILSDVMMPEMSGEALMHAVRAHHDLGRTPIVLLTAKADDELRVRLLREGAQDYLTKPFSIEELRARVGNLVAMKTADEAVRASEVRHQNIMENLAEVYALHEALLDAEGEPYDYRYLAVNPAFERILGLKREQVVGRTVLEIFPDTEPYWLEIFGKVAVTGQPERLEQYGRHFGRYFEVRASSPERGLVAVFFADVTERRQAEDRLRQAATYSATRWRPS